MSQARERILNRIRQGLAAHAGDDLRRARVQSWISNHTRGTTPSRALGEAPALTTLFLKMVGVSGATCTVVASKSELPSSIAEFLRSHNITTNLRAGGDPLLAMLDWESEPQLALSNGPAEPDDTVGLSVASSGVAETGTLVLTSGADNPTSLNFLPETHIIALPASRLCATYEDAWDALREVHRQAILPRAVNFITGPSRTADIEQTLLMGAHGPRRLRVFLIEDA